jgi:hypothetical protein
VLVASLEAENLADGVEGADQPATVCRQAADAHRAEFY